MTIKSKKIPPSDPPTRAELSLGNKATKHNPLSWAAACKIAADNGGNPLRVSGKFYHVFVPPGHSGSGIYGTWEDIPDPCAPRTIPKLLARAKAMVERGEASRTDVSTRAEYVHGGSQYGHHARWDHGGWARDDDGLGRVRRRRSNR